MAAAPARLLPEAESVLLFARASAALTYVPLRVPLRALLLLQLTLPGTTRTHARTHARPGARSSIDFKNPHATSLDGLEALVNQLAPAGEPEIRTLRCEGERLEGRVRAAGNRLTDAQGARTWRAEACQAAVVADERRYGSAGCKAHPRPAQAKRVCVRARAHTP